MKNSVLLLMLSFTFFLVSCNSNTTKKEETKEIEAVDMNGKEYTSTYICPMHCAGSGSEEPGKCPVCEMDYVLNEDKADEGEMMEEDMENGDMEDGEGHEGDDHEGHNH